MILAYFGELRHLETTKLHLEQMTSTPEGIHVTRPSRRRRGKSSPIRFLVPRRADGPDAGPNYAAIVDLYLQALKEDLGISSGRAFWTGKNHAFVQIPFGKNQISGLPRLMAKLLGKEHVKDYSFQSFKRSAADSDTTS